MGGRGGGGNRWGGGGGNRGGVGGNRAAGGGRGQRGENNVRETREDVKKFLTFYKRTKSVCIDLYCPAFYKRKPYYDEVADFVYDILCPNAQLRADLEDVQLHPVKKHLFIKFRTETSRDAVAEKLSGEGLEWPAFETKVQGWAMDKPMVFVRVLGASPESNQEDVKGVMSQYGEIIEVRKGQLSKKLPNCTNGTWTVRMIVGEGKVIPSFVFVSADGEIWQLAHDNQETICWKCGGKNHIGSRCREKAVSIEADLLAGGHPDHLVQAGGVVSPPPVQTWAHVVRGVGSQTKGPVENEAQKQEVLLQKLKDNEIRKEQAAKKVAEEAAAAQKLVNETVEDVQAEKVAVEKAGSEKIGPALAETVEVEKVDVAEEDKEIVPAAAAEKPESEKAVENVDDVAASDQVVKISSPVDSILPPSKMIKSGSGFAVPSCEPTLGSSPDLHHKAARDGLHVEEVFSQHGSFVPDHIQQGSTESFSDVGSSNAFRPDSSMELSETTK